jgi:hypothetical protein
MISADDIGLLIRADREHVEIMAELLESGDLIAVYDGGEGEHYPTDVFTVRRRHNNLVTYLETNGALILPIANA